MYANEKMPHDQYIGGSDTTEARPLAELAPLADELAKFNSGLSEYLARFNGPQPAELVRGENARPPSCYRTEIERLRQTIRDTGVLTDQINRLG